VDLKQFTAEIFTPDGKISLGAGFLISEDGLVATAFHVVEPFYNHGQEVQLRFDKATSEVKKAPARYVTRPGRPADDLIILQADLDVLELRPPAPLAAADDMSDAKFRAYGFAEFGAAGAFLLDGLLLGTVRHGDSDNAADLVQMRCRLAEKGMSGAAVWDLSRKVVIGLISSRPKKPDLLIAHAVDARLLVDYLAQQNKTPCAPKRAAARDDFAGRTWRLSQALTDRMEEAPEIFDEYVERRWMKRDFAEDLADPAARVLSVVAIGGQGKTTFTRRRLDDITPPPKARFWWPCYTVAEPDKLLAALYDWLSAGADNGDPPGGQERAAAVISLLNQADVVAVIDGFEVMQHGPGDRYGEVADGDLRALLVGLSRSAGKGKLVISSRYPLADLAAEPAHRAHPLDRLDDGDGVQLLRKYGVSEGSEAALAAINQRWDGHALTLSLIAAHIRSHCAGDPAQAEDIALTDGDQYEKLRRVMARYDRDLAEPERRYLLLLAAFRRSAPPAALTGIIAASGQTDDICAPLRGVDLAAVRARLAGLGLLRGGEATPHPLVQAYFQDKLEQAAETPHRRLHRRIADYYQSVAKPPVEEPNFPTLDDLAPWVEAVHHLLAADEPQAAYEVLRDKIEQDPRFVLSELGAMRLRADILGGFLTDKAHTRLPDGRQSCLCVNWLGVARETLGEIRAALALHRRNANYAARIDTGVSRAVALGDVLRLLVRLGGDGGEGGEQELSRSSTSPRRKPGSTSSPTLLKRWIPASAGMTEKVENDGEAAAPSPIPALLDEILTCLEALSGETLERNDSIALKNATSAAAFTGDAAALGRAEKLAKKFNVNLCTWTGGDSLIPYLEHCRRHGAPPQDWYKALRSQIFSTTEEIIYRRTLGDLAGDAFEKRAHYDAAVTAARKTTNRLALMGVLNARGRFLARHGEAERARADLEEAFQYAIDAEFKLEEVNARVGLAWLYKAEGRPDKARTMAGRALEMSQRINYPWGRDDAQEVLSVL
jgi:tetratricopeptide (TPR) repeat protein